MSDIKIFVSHRIDKDSVTIDNPLYVNVRCGAVYDKRSPEEIGGMLGDDTGDNISEKKNSFCELTVQYWAWKNIQADYYGLCHYRRYLSFSSKIFKTNTYGVIPKAFLDTQVIKTFSLVEDVMRECIEQYDIITAVPVDVRMLSPEIKNIYDYCHLSNNDFNLDDIELLLDVIKELYPNFYEIAVNYYKQPYSRWYNCFIMKKEIFHNFCKWQFNILFTLETRLKMDRYSAQMKRELGFFGEHLYGIYFNYLKSNFNYNILEKQILFIENTEKEIQLRPFCEENNIPIVLMSSNFYVPYLSVVIQSIIQHANEKNNYDIIVLNKEITSDNKDILLGMCSKYNNISLRFYDPSSKTNNRNFYVAASTYSEEAYYRLLVPWILKDFEKAIVLDCDLIVKRDLADLLNVPMTSDQCIAAVKDVVYQGMLNGIEPDLKIYCKNEMKLKNPYNYVNTGVMVYNLVAIRNIMTEEKILNFASSHKFRIQEQDILNVIYEDHIYLLDLRWNYYVKVNEIIKTCITYAPAESAMIYDECRKTPYIIHYANNPKPWNAPSVDLGYEWWQYARLSPYYEEIILRMTASNETRLAVCDLQSRLGLFDHRTGARKLADKLLPKGSRRREFAKKLLPKGSRRWNFCKQIYFIIRPKYRPKKQEDDELEDIA